MITFLAHVHIFDATPVWQSLYGDHGGVGWGWDDNVPCTCHVHIFDVSAGCFAVLQKRL